MVLKNVHHGSDLEGALRCRSISKLLRGLNLEGVHSSLTESEVLKEVHSSLTKSEGRRKREEGVRSSLNLFKNKRVKGEERESVRELRALSIQKLFDQVLRNLSLNIYI